MASKLEKRVDEVAMATNRLQRDVGNVKDENAKIFNVQNEQYELVKTFADNKASEVSNGCTAVA